MSLSKIEFRKIPIPSIYRNRVVNDIYYVVENDRSIVMDNFINLNDDEKDIVKALLINMATIKNFKSPKIIYNLKKYNYGELKPKPHRFFFFQKCGNNYVLFSYVMKKKNSLNDEFYKRLNKEKIRYEKEFEKYIQRNR